MIEPSGPQWCSRFPTSRSVSDLIPPFRGNVMAFIGALEDAGATVTIDATYRPPERAYLMHFASLIGHGAQDPAMVPTTMQGVGIDWTHQGDLKGAVSAAKAMCAGYGIVYPPALQSRHTQRRAIDMKIGWEHGMLSVKTANGITMQCNDFPRDGTNPSIVSVARSYSVIKLIGDLVHFSDDGH